MAQTLAQLTTPLSKAQWMNLLLLALQGVGIVTPTGLGGGSCLLGTGGISLSGTPAQTLSSPTAVVVTIVGAGELGAATFTYSIAGAVSSTVTIPSPTGIFLMPNTGISITFNPGPSGAGTSFMVGDTFTFALNPSILPVTSWQTGSAFRTIVEIESQALADLNALVSAVAASGLTTISTGSWLDLLANNFYALYRNAATFTAGVVSLSALINTGPYSVTPGSMWVADSAGHLFQTTGNATLLGAIATPVNAAFTAGTGSLINGTYSYRVTALNAQGETLPSAETSLVISAGPQGANVNWVAVTGASGYKVYGRSTGAEQLLATVGAVTTYLDNGSLTPSGAMPTVNTTGTLANVEVQAQYSGSAYNVGNNAITLISAGTLPGVTVLNPATSTGTWITFSGANVETDSALAVRCQARWPALSQSAGTAAVYTLWALSAEQAAGHGTTITRTLVLPDPAIAGQVDVYLATATGAAGASAVTDANSYIQARIPLCSTASVQAATTSAMTVAGTVYYFSTKTTLGAVTAAVQAALSNYIQGVPLGSDSAGTVKVYWSEISGAASEAYGVRNCSMTLNAGTADVALLFGQVATLTIGSITYSPVTA